MFALAKEYNEDEDYDFGFSADDIRQLDERREKRLSGESKTYIWQEAKEIIKSNRSPKSE